MDSKTAKADKNIKANSFGKQLFLLNDPRFLAGISRPRSGERERYVSSKKLIAEKRIFDLPADVTDRTSLLRYLSKERQNIYYGLHGYGTWRTMNCSLSTDKDFSVGIELEVVANTPEDYCKTRIFTAQKNLLASNWLFCDRDGSLPSQGVEIKTIPLSEKFARNPNLWGGLCAYVNRFFSSERYRETGLHVHVGLDYFRNDKFGRSESAIKGQLVDLYYKINDMNPTFYTALFCRENRSYCHKLDPSRDKVFLDKLTSELKHKAPKNIINKLQKYSGSLFKIKDYTSAFSNNEHSAEVNLTLGNTIEFRRGDGTINPCKIHAMIEFIYLLCDTVKHNEVTYLNDEALAKSLVDTMAKQSKSVLLSFFTRTFFMNEVCIPPKPWPLFT